jgi:hypothetical protein
MSFTGVEEPPPAACRSCGAPVLWITVHPGGRRMPVDAEPVAGGNLLVDLVARRGLVLTADHLAVVLEETPDEPLYRSHFATCPDAILWRSNQR